MYADENVIKIKHAVLREVAKLAVRTVWERHVSMHVNSVPLRRDVIVPTLIRRNVKSVDDVQLHVLTMQSRI